MPQRKSIAAPESFQTFGDLLVYLRKRARLTQEELGRAVGYSRPQITLLEKNQRLPSITAVTALFVPALDLTDAPDLAQRLITLAAAAHKPRTNLPAPVNVLIGRERDIDRMCDYLRSPDKRLVTLIGPPGIGKTRLSLAVAREMLSDFKDGVFFSALAPLDQASLVAPTLVQTLGFIETGNQAPLERLIDGIGEKQVLLVLDNVEHLIEGTAPLVADLLRACPHLKMVTTSREALRVPGEWLYPVPSLHIPTPLQLRTLTMEEVAAFAALTLFAERARAVQPDFRLTMDNLSTVAAICTRLAGLPLAIELIAARIRLMTPEVLLSRLTSDFTLHADGLRGVPARQKTLYDAIAWSYAQLSPAEQTLLRHLSVFAGGWALEAAEVVCVDEIEADRRAGPYEVLDVLTRLVNKSLVIMEQRHNGETRYRMLETIRQYAREKLLETDGSKVVQDRHLAYFVKLVEQAEPQLYQSDQVRWLNRLDDELDNLRMALEWALATNVESGLRIATLLRRWWEEHGYFREMGGWLAQLLERYSAIDSLHACTSANYSYCLFFQNNVAEALRIAGQSLQMARTLSDKETEALSLKYLGEFLARQGRTEESTPLLEQSLALYRALGSKIGQANLLSSLSLNSSNRERATLFVRESLQLNREIGNLSGIAFGLTTLARLTFLNGDFASPASWLEEALALARQIGDQTTEEYALLFGGGLAYWQGDFRQAQAYYEEGIQLSEKLGDYFYGTWTRVFMAYVLLRQGNLRQARELFEACVQRVRKGDWPNVLVFAVEGLASLNVNQAQAERAARLFAWADVMREKIGDHRPPVEQATVDRDLATIHARLDDVAIEQAYQTGRAMTLDETIVFALED